MDRIEAMTTLVAAVDAGSLSGASRELGKPLATVSRKVSDLEAHLGTQLLIRSSRRLTLTEAAERSPPRAVVLVDQALAKRTPLKPIQDRPCLILLPPEARSRIARARKTGFAGYLIKPLRATSLAERVLAVRGGVTRQTSSGRDERGQDATAPGARVLLVEDNPINALLARKLLEREGCSVDQAGGAHAAILAAVSGRYDLILMDRRLPDLDGLTATRRLRDMGVACPIVALTADAFEEDRRACLAAGMDDFLTKPLDPNALRAILARAQQGQFGAWTPARKDAKLAS